MRRPLPSINIEIERDFSCTNYRMTIHLSAPAARSTRTDLREAKSLVGNIGKLAEAAAKNRAALVKLEAGVAKLEAMVAEGLTKLDARVLVADAIDKIRAEDARREVEARHAMAFAKANVTPAEYEGMARRNGWPAP